MAMWAYRIKHRVTGETMEIHGVTYPNACHRAGLDPDEWDVVKQIIKDGARICAYDTVGLRA